MAACFQLVTDCADPEPLARFWASALEYELEAPPARGVETHDDLNDRALPDRLRSLHRNLDGH